MAKKEVVMCDHEGCDREGPIQCTVCEKDYCADHTSEWHVQIAPAANVGRREPVVIETHTRICADCRKIIDSDTFEAAMRGFQDEGQLSEAIEECFTAFAKVIQGYMAKRALERKQQHIPEGAAAATVGRVRGTPKIQPVGMRPAYEIAPGALGATQPITPEQRVSEELNRRAQGDGMPDPNTSDTGFDK